MLCGTAEGENAERFGQPQGELALQRDYLC